MKTKSGINTILFRAPHQCITASKSVLQSACYFHETKNVYYSNFCTHLDKFAGDRECRLRRRRRPSRRLPSGPSHQTRGHPGDPTPGGAHSPHRSRTAPEAGGDPVAGPVSGPRQDTATGGGAHSEDHTHPCGEAGAVPCGTPGCLPHRASGARSRGGERTDSHPKAYSDQGASVQSGGASWKILGT